MTLFDPGDPTVPSGPARPIVVDADAHIDRGHRFHLYRQLASGEGTVLWIMLNPSVADADRPDPTLTRCISYSHREGYRRLEVVNLFSRITADPAALLPASITGAQVSRAEEIIRWAASNANAAICGWGSWGPNQVCRDMVANRSAFVLSVLEHYRVPTWCLGRTASGAPRHPLYLPADAELERYP